MSRDSSLGETSLNILKELGGSIDTSDLEGCHRIGPTIQKKVMVKMSRSKDADKKWRVKKDLKHMKLESLEVDNPTD